MKFIPFLILFLSFSLSFSPTVIADESCTDCKDQSCEVGRPQDNGTIALYTIDCTVISEDTCDCFLTPEQRDSGLKIYTTGQCQD